MFVWRCSNDLLSAHLGLLRTINMVSHSQSLPILTCLPHFGHTASFAEISLFSTNMTDIHVHTKSMFDKLIRF
jgi:hypothetical protein